jgi:hypothetical protein
MKTVNTKTVSKANNATAKKAIVKQTGIFCYKDKSGIEISGNANDADVKKIAYREQNLKYAYKFVILGIAVVLLIVFKEQILVFVPSLIIRKLGTVLTTTVKNWLPP